jgi:hypothetical protein
MRMASLVFRLCVLVLAVLLQVGSWRAEAASNTGVAAAPPPALGDFDAPEEDASEELLSAVDDTVDSMLAGGYQPGCHPAPSHRFQRTEEGLPAGGPPLDTPFKPPRA